MWKVCDSFLTENFQKCKNFKILLQKYFDRQGEHRVQCHKMYSKRRFPVLSKYGSLPDYSSKQINIGQPGQQTERSLKTISSLPKMARPDGQTRKNTKLYIYPYNTSRHNHVLFLLLVVGWKVRPTMWMIGSSGARGKGSMASCLGRTEWGEGQKKWSLYPVNP